MIVFSLLRESDDCAPGGHVDVELLGVFGSVDQAKAAVGKTIPWTRVDASVTEGHEPGHPDSYTIEAHEVRT